MKQVGRTLWLSWCVLAALLSASSSHALAQDRVQLNTISRVEVRGGAVEITGSRRPSFTMFTLTDPPRLVVDVSEAVFAGVPAEQQVADGTITGIRVQSFGSDSAAIARVVIGFERELETDIVASGNQLVVKLPPDAKAAARLAAEQATRARLERERLERERTEAEQLARAEQRHKAEEERARLAQLEADRLARVEAERVEKERVRREQEETARLAREEQERQKREAQERLRREAEEQKRVAAERKRLAEEQKRLAGEAQAAKLKAEAEEKERQRAAAAEQKRLAEEAKAAKLKAEAEEKERQRAAAAQQKRLAEEARAAKVKAEAEERERLKEEARAEAAARRQAQLTQKQRQAEEAEQARLTKLRAAAEREERAREEAEGRRQAELARAAQQKELRQRELEEAAARTPSPTELAQGPVQMTFVGFKQGDGVGRVILRTSSPSRYQVGEDSGGAVVVTLRNTVITLPNNQRILDTSFFDTAVSLVRPEETSQGDVLVRISLKQAVGYRMSQAGNELTLEFERVE